MIKNDKRHLLLSIPIGMSVRNIIETDVFPELLKHFTVTIISSFNRCDLNIENNHNVKLINYPKLNFIQSVIFSYYKKIDYFSFWLRFHPDTPKKHIKRIKQESLLNYYLQFFFGWWWNRIIDIGLDNKIKHIIFFNNEYDKIFREFNFDLIFVPSTDVSEDNFLMTAAKRRKIPITSFVHSWDNLPGRGSLLVTPDALLVWNEIMKEQALKLHKMPSQKVHVVGIPQYDTYLFKTKFLMRTEFLKNKNIENYDNVITYTCNNERIFPDQTLFLKSLLNKINSKLFGNTVLIIRLHPHTDPNLFLEQFGEKQDFILDIPDGSFTATYTSSIESGGIENFVNLIRHSDIIINLASTVTIDAAIFDKPIINIAYNIKLSSEAWNSAPDWYETTHYRHIIATKGVCIVHSERELIDAIHRYLNDPLLDHEGRLRIVHEQCDNIDGLSAKRIVNVLNTV